MGANLDERDLASILIEDSLKEKAIITELFRSSETKKHNWGWRKSIEILCVWIAIMYLGSMILTTVLVQQDYEYTYGTNMATIQEAVCTSVNVDVIKGVNVLSNLSLLQDERQMFSVAVYDANAKLIAKTTPSLFFVLDDGTEYYCSLKDYMDDSQIQELFDYAYRTSEPYRIEAELGKETGTLRSLKFIATYTSQNNTVWKWDNSEKNLNKEETDCYSKHIPVRQVLSIPCYQDIDAYEKWNSNEFLQSFPLELNEKTRKTTVNHETFTLSKSNAESITEVTCVNDAGENETCYVVIRSVGSTLLSAIKLLIPVYVVGLIFAILFICYWRAWIIKKKEI